MDNFTKARARSQLKSVRDSIPAEAREKKSKKIAKRLFELPFMGDIKTVFVYLSFRSEVETQEIIQRFLDLGIRVALPLCNSQDHSMRAVEITSLSQLKEGYCGIMEPDPNLPDIPVNHLNLAIIPALGFDITGQRMGYGGGFYDRFLENFNEKKVGLAFSECVADSLPHEEFDRPVDIIVTEDNEIYVRKQK